jgi:isoquinoline 1-oxidoreductase beta subunit
MTRNNTASTRRSFLKVSALAGDGMLFGIGWFSDSYAADMPATSAAGLEGGELNGYVKITPDNVIRIMCPNPKGGQNVKTSMPMIVAEEPDVDWKDVVVEQAPLNTDRYTRQFIGGSQAIHQSWTRLRTAGATARQMLRAAAADQWKVPIDEITTEAGVLHHKISGKSAKYGQMASAAAKVRVPKEVSLKSVKDSCVPLNTGC